MINWEAIDRIDEWLDRKVGQRYKDQPLAQDWARVSKVNEESGEAIAELILATGQNPRKGIDPEAYPRLLKELADVALSAILAIQHFTKDTEVTAKIIDDKIESCRKRIPQPITDQPTPDHWGTDHP